MRDLAREALIEDVVLTAIAEGWEEWGRDAVVHRGPGLYIYERVIRDALYAEGLWPCRWDVPSAEAIARRLHELDEDRDLAIALGAP